ncbi:hypothetical protein EYB31_01195 [Paenibacillus thalictri]|uniref:Phosphodiester glycosidase domain-containing protein n=1 Tax=Paenibacillus thalictri TaxID=2527873 RepID=A0A4Q9E2J7_9BACL|nr:hypothetical protein EYB31_01195 [Paenibacillus thalictri]
MLTFTTSSFLFLTPQGSSIREFLAETVITTQHRDWAWIFVGAEQRDYMVRKLQESYDLAAEEKQDIGLIHHSSTKAQTRLNRSIDDLIKVEDISGTFWKGKKMYVYDPSTIKIMTPAKAGEGERITSMVQRTGAVAGVNAGGFVDPDGLGNGFAPIGFIIAGSDIIYTDQDGSVPQHTVGFTKEGTLVIGKYDIFELRKMGVSEAAMFYPRVIANGKALITSGDGGWGRGPRTAVGQKADGTVIFIVIDGRQASSVGATLKEVQDLLLEEGCINAGFLDGGASSELVVDGKLVTKPSSRYGERRLPSAFLIYDHPEDIQANRVWDGVDKIDPGGAYDHPDFLREQAQIKANQAKNPTPATPPKQETTTPVNTEKNTDNDTKTNETGTKTNDGSKTPAKPGGTTETKPGETDASGKPVTGTGTPAGTGQTGNTSVPQTGKPATGGTTAPNGSGAAGGQTQPNQNGGGNTGAGGTTGNPSTGQPAAGTGAAGSGGSTTPPATGTTPLPSGVTPIGPKTDGSGPGAGTTTTPPAPSKPATGATSAENGAAGAQTPAQTTANNQQSGGSSQTETPAKTTP